MPSASAKLFEWHRTQMELRLKRAQLEEVLGSREESAREVELRASVTELLNRSDELLRELKQMRTAAPATD
jgi:hypothetical protein